MVRRGFFVVAVVVACGLGAARSATAEEDPRPRAALAACAAGQVKDGVAILAELYAETRDPAFVFNQGRCYQQNGVLEPARERFAEYLRIGRNEPPADRARAERFMKELDDGLARRRTLAAQESPVVKREREGRRRGLKVVGIGLASLGVVAVATGVYLGLQVQSAERDIEKMFPTPESVVNDPRALNRRLEDGTRLETWQFISYGVGVAALAGAVTTLAFAGVFSPSSGGGGDGGGASVALAPVISPGGVGGLVRLRF